MSNYNERMINKHLLVGWVNDDITEIVVDKAESGKDYSAAYVYNPSTSLWDRSKNFYEMIKDFYDATEQARPAVPTAMPAERRRQFMSYLLSEIVEIGESTTLERQVCEVTDLLYFVMDMFVELGVDPTIPFNLIHEANMRKVFEDGKAHWDHSVVPSRLLKPDGWESAEEKIIDYIRSIR